MIALTVNELEFINGGNAAEDFGLALAQNAQNALNSRSANSNVAGTAVVVVSAGLAGFVAGCAYFGGWAWSACS
jgi:hypothetical protein